MEAATEASGAASLGASVEEAACPTESTTSAWEAGLQSSGCVEVRAMNFADGTLAWKEDPDNFLKSREDSCFHTTGQAVNSPWGFEA